MYILVEMTSVIVKMSNSRVNKDVSGYLLKSFAPLPQHFPLNPCLMQHGNVFTLRQLIKRTVKLKKLKLCNSPISNEHSTNIYIYIVSLRVSICKHL